MLSLSRKPAALLWSSANFCSGCYTPSPQPCTTSCIFPYPPQQAQLSHLRYPPQRRAYAQHAPHPSSQSSQSQSQSHPDELSQSQSHCHDAADLTWPDPIHPHQTPTPYQLLNCTRGEIYSKQRFYFLVKLYHPDHCTPSSPIAHLPHAVRLERYRLLVAAHTILSDSSKRKAYDAWGHGWAGHHQPSANAWPSGHNPMTNATWEDWEDWYQKQNGKEDPSNFQMSNFTFITIAFAVVALGGIVQGTGVNLISNSVIEQRDRIHQEAVAELARSKRATISGDREERIRTFLEHREANIAGADAYQRLLPPTENCTPGSVRNTGS